MPCILKVRVVSARNLPIMDRTTELTDAFVEVRFSDYDSVRTQICRRTLNPVWNEDFRFEVSDDADLQNEPLEIKVMDYDQITYNDAIGGVFIDLNPLLAWDSNSQIAGWFPIFDSLRGVRGEMNIQVKLQFFGDSNRFSDSSAGVQFFTSPCVPVTHYVTTVLGFVSSLDKDDDPEYHWADNFRTPRTSNEARMRIMYQLSGQLRRQLGKKVLELNGNAVVGYKQYFDMEAEQRVITARAIGTAVKLTLPDQTIIDRGLSWLSMASPTGAQDSSGAVAMTAPSPGIMSTPGAKLSRSPPSDRSVNKEDSASASPKEIGLPGPLMLLGANYRSVEQHQITISKFPVGAVLGIGGFVCVTSVKILENDSKEVREAWWAEVRDEIKSHARTLGCPLIVGYSESTTIHEDMIVLYCYGTAAMIDLTVFNVPVSSTVLSQGDRTRVESSANSIDMKNAAPDRPPVGTDDGSSLEDAAMSPHNVGPVPVTTQRPSLNGGSFKDGAFLEKFAKRRRRRRKNLGCQACHITYNRAESTFPMVFVKCGVCKKKYVPEIILTTMEPPVELETVGKGVMVEAHVCRQKKSRGGESQASTVSEAMPFAQYDIHRQLMFKLRIYGLNAVFGLKLQFAVGEALITAVATGTAMYVKALPPPPPLKVFRNLEVLDEEDKKLLEIQRKIMQQSEFNRKQIESTLQHGSVSDSLDMRSEKKPKERISGVGSAFAAPDEEQQQQSQQQQGDDDKGDTNGGGSDNDSDSDTTSESEPEFEANTRQRNVVVQIDDEQDEDLVLLLDPTFSNGFELRNIETMGRSDPLSNPSNTFKAQMLTMIRQGTISMASHHPNRQLASLFNSIYEELQFQLWYISPCIVVGVDYDIQLLKTSDVQIRLTAVALGIIQREDQIDDGQSESGESETFSMLEEPDAKPSSHPTSFRTSKVTAPGTPGAGASGNPVGADGRQMTEASLISNGTDDQSSSAEDEDNLVFSMEDDDDDKKSLAPQLVAGGNAMGAGIPLPGDAMTSAQSSPLANVINNTNNNSTSTGNNLNLNASVGLLGTSAASTGLGGVPFGTVPTGLSGMGSATPTAAGGTMMPLSGAVHWNVEITPLSYIPQARVDRFLGRVSLHFVKEASIVYEQGTGVGGMGGFAHALLAELYAVARAHAGALGGNGLISFTVEQSVFSESIKNQGYSLISVSGDVVEVSYQGTRSDPCFVSKILGH
ncbi:hypothetical protein HDU76_003606 [Blyttiomyces sp. JEL0837]|nr:hypothetical protein HDU76_003606 [Blyttiomyces sp. JEL0837]